MTGSMFMDLRRSLRSAGLADTLRGHALHYEPRAGLPADGAERSQLSPRRWAGSARIKVEKTGERRGEVDPKRPASSPSPTASRRWRWRRAGSTAAPDRMEALVEAGVLKLNRSPTCAAFDFWCG